ncbi:MAG: hypothetical protein ABR568_19020 [Pyrinomonadaceae bacterium]
MKKRSYVAGYLLGLALPLVSLASATLAQSAAPRGNGKIAFASSRYDGHDRSGITVMNSDGSGRAQLTATQILCPQPNRPGGCGPDQLDYSPAWSPDGKQIAFIRSVPAPNFRYDYDVFVMNADGSNQRRLTLLGMLGYDRPAWSPDGTKIAFTGPPVTGYTSGIHVINVDGTGQTPLGQGACPAWAPDGSKLAICGGGGLQLMNPDGSGRTQITAPQSPAADLVDYDSAPAWSPDGTRILFNRSVGCDFDDACQSITIWTVNADGSNPAKLADIAASGRLAWSPDGAKIVFSGNGDLFTMEAYGSNVTNITNTPDEAEWMPSWQAVAVAPPPASNPIDDPQFFVRQHYLDFLSREPDPAGLAFWTGEITQCGADLQCVEVKRINISAAFFLSIEFQQTGYLAYRAYKAAYGDATSPNVPGTVPVVRLNEFLPDTQQIGQGVRVGIGDWEGQLESNKRAYMAGFVQRQRFLDAFPLTLTPAQFVDRLNQNAGGVLTEAERDVLVAQLSSNPDVTAGRAAALRQVAESPALRQAEFNRVFVLMQYYGYLRRNPDDPQDADFSGWKFWTDKLNQFDGSFAQAEMVKAFISSIEYRRRFGQP